MLSNEDEALLQDAAFQLIASSVDPKALFQEMVSLSKKARLDSTNSLSGSLHVENLLSVTCEVGAPEKYENSVLATPVLAKQVLDLASTFPFPCSSRDRNTEVEFQMCIHLMNKSIQKGVFIPSLCWSMLSECQLPLEMLWRLHECQAIQLDAYLASKVCEKSFQCSVVKDLVKLCQCTQADRPGKRKVLAGLTSHFLLKGYLVENSSLRKVYTKMLDGVLEALIDVPESGDESPRPLLLTDFSDFEENFPVEALRKFSLHALSVLLAYKAELSAEESLRQQGDWDQLSTHDTMREMMKQLFLLLDCEEVVGCLERFLAAGRINVRSVYTFSSALLVSYENAAPVLSDFVKKRLSEAVESSSVQQVACALLLSRLSSLLGPHLFPPYQDWFQDAVGKNSSSVAPTKSTFLFLVNFLSSLVPVERPEYLKAHILRRPYVPPKGKETYEDYVILAKTRLVDLKVPLNDVWGGIYDNPSSSSVSTVTAAKADAAEQDVEKAVQAFADSGKIPTALIEASIFRKPYFIGKFLAALLKPRLLPDEPDMRMKLIEEVKRSGRIPENLYSRYQEGCHKERQALLEGD
ncbi:Fanconi anemia group A protein [Aplysia californica]|uniref:Fanconi anemia group A protein n=1 Tax=Aplysia californica TaxID=6500 RepID=A0ABM1AER4_APLCA|nr:Fanconi anemia group A protein [Aplysia californica]